MKMATGEGFPLRQGAGMGLYWLSVAMKASGSGTPDLLCSPIVLGYMEIYRWKKYDRGATRVEGAPRGVGAPPASCLRRCFPYVYSKSSGLLPFQK